MPEVEEKAALCESSVLVAVNELLHSPAATMLGEAGRLKAELLRLQSALAVLFEEEATPQFANEIIGHNARKAPLAKLREQFFRLFDPDLLDADVKAKAQAAGARWREARMMHPVRLRRNRVI